MSYKPGQSCTKQGLEHDYENRGNYAKCRRCNATKTLNRGPSTGRQSGSRGEDMPLGKARTVVNPSHVFIATGPEVYAQCRVCGHPASTHTTKRFLKNGAWKETGNCYLCNQNVFFRRTRRAKRRLSKQIAKGKKKARTRPESKEFKGAKFERMNPAQMATMFNKKITNEPCLAYCPTMKQFIETNEQHWLKPNSWLEKHFEGFGDVTDRSRHSHKCVVQSCPLRTSGIIKSRPKRSAREKVESR